MTLMTYCRLRRVGAGADRQRGRGRGAGARLLAACWPPRSSWQSMISATPAQQRRSMPQCAGSSRALARCAPCSGHLNISWWEGTSCDRGHVASAALPGSHVAAVKSAHHCLCLGVPEATCHRPLLLPVASQEASRTYTGLCILAHTAVLLVLASAESVVCTYQSVMQSVCSASAST